MTTPLFCAYGMVPLEKDECEEMASTGGGTASEKDLVGRIRPVGECKDDRNGEVSSKGTFVLLGRSGEVCRLFEVAVIFSFLDVILIASAQFSCSSPKSFM
mmetsp:Transcript_11500/g.12664  ORF Transcript_11500/g.12664 Transcript_11500/m.12664 type:complete len:101 (-) Transcript_11500:348-650(-)